MGNTFRLILVFRGTFSLFVGFYPISYAFKHSANALRIIRSKIRAKFCGGFLYESLNRAAFQARPPFKDSCKVPRLPSLKKWHSLLKNPFVELIKEEKYRKSPSYETYPQYFGSKTYYFAFLKTHQLSFSTRWTVF